MIVIVALIFNFIYTYTNIFTEDIEFVKEMEMEDDIYKKLDFDFSKVDIKNEEYLNNKMEYCDEDKVKHTVCLANLPKNISRFEVEN